MVSIGLKTYLNQFRLGLRPGPHWGSLQRSPEILSWWGEGSLPLLKTLPPPGPCGPRCLHRETPLRKINPSYGLAASYRKLKALSGTRS